MVRPRGRYLINRPRSLSKWTKTTNRQYQYFEQEIRRATAQADLQSPSPEIQVRYCQRYNFRKKDLLSLAVIGTLVDRKSLAWKMLRFMCDPQIEEYIDQPRGNQEEQNYLEVLYSIYRTDQLSRNEKLAILFNLIGEHKIRTFCGQLEPTLDRFSKSLTPKVRLIRRSSKRQERIRGYRDKGTLRPDWQKRDTGPKPTMLDYLRLVWPKRQHFPEGDRVCQREKLLEMTRRFRAYQAWIDDN